ncbi:MAG: hypothetical protein IJK52_13800, partial [Oscillospiraceae bacterium]|nr:hypothetical protein [Oscillospiraceae bacterium]
MEAILKNPEHPEYGTAAIPVPFSIVAEEYEESMRQLAAMGIGDPLARDCVVEEIRDALPIFNRLKGQRVNADELDYLGKRMESFDCDEEIQFSAMAHIMGLTAVKDLINLTFCVSDVTVIRNFSNLASEGKLHYLHIRGGASQEELRNLDPVKLVSDLIASGKGAVTPYGVVYQYYDDKQQELAGEIFKNVGLKRSKLTNSWVTFVVGCSQLLKERGKIGFVLPSELLQVSYAKQLRHYLASTFNKINIISFENLVFEEIQQEVVILLCEKNGTDEHLIEHLEVKDANALSQLDPRQLKFPTKHIDFH